MTHSAMSRRRDLTTAGAALGAHRAHPLKNSHVLVIREAAGKDAPAVLDYIEAISGESDFLTFGPGEFELTEAEEEDFLRKCHDSDNQLYILGLIDDTIVSTLSFSAGRRPPHSTQWRIRHVGAKTVLGPGNWLVDACHAH